MMESFHEFRMSANSIVSFSRFTIKDPQVTAALMVFLEIWLCKSGSSLTVKKGIEMEGALG